MKVRETHIGPGGYPIYDDGSCANCDGRKCTACCLREIHDECEDDCPFCCAIQLFDVEDYRIEGHGN